MTHTAMFAKHWQNAAPKCDINLEILVFDDTNKSAKALKLEH